MTTCHVNTPLLNAIDINYIHMFYHSRNTLATLTMFSVPTSLQNAKCGDSMTLAIGRWLGIPGLPYCVSLLNTPCTAFS